MNSRVAALTAVSAESPRIPVAEIARAVEQQYGLAGSYQSLISERDQNFRLKTADRSDYVVKVVSSAEADEVSEFYIAALRHLETLEGVSVPRIIPTLDTRSSGSIVSGGKTYRLRLLGFLTGQPLASAAIDSRIARDFGSKLAMLDVGLNGFSHAGEKPELLWDLQRAAELRDLLGYIDDAIVLQRVTRVIDDFEELISPALRSLRAQVVHGDANPENVLIDPSGERVTGIIDFGDMVRAPLVFDVAIAASYLRSTAADPLKLIAPFVAGYHAKEPLQLEEIALLFDLVRARLATTITLLFWRAAARNEDDPYRQKSLAREADAHAFLCVLDTLGRANFLQLLRRELQL